MTAREQIINLFRKNVKEKINLLLTKIKKMLKEKTKCRRTKRTSRWKKRSLARAAIWNYR